MHDQAAGVALGCADDVDASVAVNVGHDGVFDKWRGADVDGRPWAFGGLAGAGVEVEA